MDDLLDRIAGLSPAKRAILEQRLRQRASTAELARTIPIRSQQAPAAASFAQQRLWFLQQLDPGSSSYNVPRAIRLRGTLDPTALVRAIAELVRRHDTFRTRFAFAGGALQQIIGDRAVPMGMVDLSGLEPEPRTARADQLIAVEAATHFDLTNGPVIRATLVRLAPREHILLLTTHHIVSDAWSAEILFRELGALYDAFVSGLPSPLPALPIQYADFAEWQRQWLTGDVLEEHLSYWRRQLESAPSLLELPTDHPRPLVPGIRGGLESAIVPALLAEALAALSRSEGVTLFMTLLGAFQLLLGKYGGQQNVVVGSPIAGRTRGETEGLIGFFINTLALRTDLGGNPTFRELLRRVKETCVGAYAHQELPFERLVEALQPERDPGHTPFFRVMFQFQSAPRAPLAMQGLEVEHLRTSSESAKFDLMLTAVEKDGVLRLLLEYSAALFEPATVQRMLGHYITLLQQAVEDPDRPAAALGLMTQSEQRRLVEDWNHTAAAFPRERSIHHLFEDEAARAPEQVALFSGRERMTFGELNDRANQLARHLRGRGVGPEARVAICVERSIDMIVGLLGILKAGGAYVPVEPSYPPQRAEFVLRDSQACLLLTLEGLAAAFSGSSIPVMCLDSDWPDVAREDRGNLAGGATAENLAHVIYTSGSTGVPKGVASAHRATVNRLAWMWAAYPFDVDDVCCQKTSLSFVDAVAEIFSPLLRGVPLVIIPDEVVKEPVEFVAALAAHRITRLVLVPSLLQVLLDTAATDLLSDLRYCVCSGETLPVELAAACRTKLPRTTLLNLYGSSEVAADVTSYEVDSAGAPPVIPIGRPIANTQAYILDEHLQPLPVDVPGEVHIGGEGLARGYLGRPELTAERFVPDPFSPQPGARLFRTGDIGRFRGDGNIEYRGRRDHQVKVRGFRIELSEIEAALKTHPDVRDAVVAARGDGREKTLVAYLVTAAGDGPAPRQVREHLRRTLPDYMLPTAFVRLEALPLTTSGKINRLALPAPAGEPSGGEEFAPPHTPTEEILAGIWAEVLGRAQIGVHDDFFDLGGHSLLLAGVAARIREAFQIEWPLRALFETSTIAALAVRIDRHRAAPDAALEAPLRPIPRNGELPLSFGQERLWFADQLDPGTAAYNIPRVLKLDGALNVSALQKALAAIVERHEVLRTAVLNESGNPALSIRAAADVPFEAIDLRHVPAADRLAHAQHFWVRETQRSFDLASPPLLRVALARLDEQEHILVLTMHHIVSDAWSIGVFMRELVALYNGYLEGDDVSLPPLPVQYVDYSAWQRHWLSGPALRNQLDYWRQQLADAPAVSGVPVDRQSVPARSARGARHPLTIAPDITRELRSLARASSVTLFMATLAAFQSLLACVTGEDDLLVGSPIAGRTRPETEPLIGYFVNTLVLRLRLSGDPTFGELLRSTRVTALAAFANQDIPFEKLVEELRPRRTVAHHPLFQVWFVLQSAPVARDEWRGLAVAPLPVDNETTRHDLQLTLWESGDGLEGAFVYSPELLPAATIERMAEQFNTLLGLVVGRPDMRVSEMRRAVEDTGRRYDGRVAEQREQAGLASLRTAARRSITTARAGTLE